MPCFRHQKLALKQKAEKQYSPQNHMILILDLLKKYFLYLYDGPLEHSKVLNFGIAQLS